jgi:hypothetical protein
MLADELGLAVGRCWAPPMLMTTASAFPLPRVCRKVRPRPVPCTPRPVPLQDAEPTLSFRQRPTPAGLTKLSRRRHPPGNPGITDNPASLRGGQLAVSEEPHPETSADAHHAHPAILGRWARNRPSRRVQSTTWPRRRAGRGIHLAGRACFATVVGSSRRTPRPPHHPRACGHVDGHEPGSMGGRADLHAV